MLAEHGRQIQGMTLQSYLFFGSANRLYQYVKTLLARQPDCRFLIFDFRLVTGIDSSATHSFAQIKQATAAHGVRIVLVNLSPELERAFRTARFISDDVTIVVRSRPRAGILRAESHRDPSCRGRRRNRRCAPGCPRPWADGEHADRLAAYCRRLEVETGDIIARQGEPAASMHFILEGRVGIIVDTGRRPDHARAQPRPPHDDRRNGLDHATAAQRDHSGRSRQACSTSLTADAYETIKREQPALSQALLAYVVAVMAERLSFANRVVGVLQR